MSEHRTGYYDKGHRIRLPYIKLARWQDLTPGNNLSWGEWGVHPLQSWHHNLADRWIVAGSRVTYRSDIIDHGSSEVIAPIIDITTEDAKEIGSSAEIKSILPPRNPENDQPVKRARIQKERLGKVKKSGYTLEQKRKKRNVNYALRVRAKRVGLKPLSHGSKTDLDRKQWLSELVELEKAQGIKV